MSHTDLTNTPDPRDEELLALRQRVAELEDRLASQSQAHSLTGLYSSAAFCQRAAAILAAQPETPFCLVYLDIVHFKLYNDWYGHEEGDHLLISLSAYCARLADENGGLAGHLGGDDFVLLLPERVCQGPQSVLDPDKLIQSCALKAGFRPAVGIYRIWDTELSVSLMCDRAALAANAAKGSYTAQVVWYDACMKFQLEYEQEILFDARQGLRRGEFLIYLQPQCALCTGKAVGVEALVRWKHPIRGMISPGDFIPLFETSGFISQLDLYIWEEVCRLIQTWKESGRALLPVSVNVSRMDLLSIKNLPTVLSDLLAKYDISPHLLELEITESAYAEDFDSINDVMGQLRAKGFLILMDDFGSGYSSLNMLKDVDVDILKIDMKFLDLTQESNLRGSGILESVQRLANWMELPVIAEGVETREQADFLLNIGCEYAQGYYYYRPMPVDEFNALLQDDSLLDLRGIQVPKHENIHLAELLQSDMVTAKMLDNILGGVAVYELEGDTLRLLRVNDGYRAVTGRTQADLVEPTMVLVDAVRPQDRASLLSAFHQARTTVPDGQEVTIRWHGPDNVDRWMSLKIFFLREQDGRAMFYATVRDVSAIRAREDELLESQHALQSMLGLFSQVGIPDQLNPDNRRTAATLVFQTQVGGLIGGYCEEDFPLFFANEELVHFLGYDSYEEFAQSIDYKVSNTIWKEDMPQVLADIDGRLELGASYTTRYRMPRKDGTLVWVNDTGRVVDAGDGRLAIVSVCLDINTEMEALTALRKANDTLRKTSEKLDFFHNNISGGYHQCANDEGNTFLYISDRFLSIIGYTREEIAQTFSNQFLRLVHPDDRAHVVAATSNATAGVPFNIQYRLLSRRGYLNVLDQTQLMIGDDGATFFGLIMDVTELVELRTDLEHVLHNTPGDVFRVKDGKIRYFSANLASSMGYTPEEYRKLLDASGSALTYPPDRPIVQAEIKRLLERRADIDITFRGVCKDGSLRYICMKGRRVEDEEGFQYYGIVLDVHEARESQSRLQQQEKSLWLLNQQFKSVIQLAALNVWEFDYTRQVLRFLNLAPHSVVGSLVSGLPLVDDVPTLEDFPQCLQDETRFAPEVRYALEDILQAIRLDKELLSGEFRFPLPDGKTIWLEVSGRKLSGEDGAPLRVIGYVRDVTQEKNRQFKGMETKQFLKKLTERSQWHWQVNLTQDGPLTPYMEESRLTDTDCAPEERYCVSIQALCRKAVMPDYLEATLEFLDRTRILDAYSQGVTSDSLQYLRLCGKTQRWFEVVYHLILLEETGDVCAYIYAMDIDEQKRREDRLRQRAEQDSLTGLYNRATAQERISAALDSLLQNNQEAALLILDLDNFKQVNDTYGHICGDTVISDIARQLKRHFRSSDILCRLGGDEFLIFCGNISRADMERRLTTLCRQLGHERDSRQTTISVGVAMAPRDGIHFEELYQKADIALYQVKKNGKSNYSFASE